MYVALTVTMLEDWGVNKVLQLPALSEQLAEVGETEPPEAIMLTAPLGVLGLPGELSVTVIVQVEAWPTLTVVHVTAVLVVL